MNKSKHVDSVEIEIVNRTQSFKVPKDILFSKIPYFEKMFSTDCCESKTLKVTLDLNEGALRNVLKNVIYDFINHSFDLVLPTMSVADYLMMDNLKKKCQHFFLDNFTIDQLPLIIDSLITDEYSSSYSTVINKPTIDRFIKLHFTKISNVKHFLSASFKTIEYICKLDVIVDSEYRVFEAIVRWVEADLKNHKAYVSKLLELIRWSYLCEDDRNSILTNVHVKDLQIMPKVNEWSKIQTNKRITTKSLIAIYEVNENVLEICVCISTKPMLWEFYHKFDRYDKLSKSLFADESIIDIIYDSGRKGIRFDLNNKKFTHLKMFGTDSYYEQISRYILDYQTSEKSYVYSLYHEKCNLNWNDLDAVESIIENGRNFIVIGFAYVSTNIYVGKAVSYKIVHDKEFSNYKNSLSIHACMAKDTIFVLEYPFKLHRLDTKDKSAKSFILINKDLQFQSLEMFEYNGKLMFCDKNSKKLYEYDFTMKKYHFVQHIATPKKMIAMTVVNCISLESQRK